MPGALAMVSMMIYFARISVCFFLSAFLLFARTAKAANPEYLDWKTLKINNQLALLCKKAELTKLLGNADSIVTPRYDEICASYFDKDFRYLYFRNSQFETSGDLAVLSSIDFESSNITLVSPAITLDKSVTWEKISKIFPLAVKRAEWIEVDKIGKVLSVKIPAAKKDTDHAWLLFFKKGRLMRMDHWIPC